MRIERLPNENGARVWAPAKINLLFEVLFKRSDGYHDVETLVAQIDIFDEIIFRFSDGANGVAISKCVDALGRPLDDVPTDERNLIVAAANAFFGEIGEKIGVDVEVLKKIPSKAGLGGGSSDAAATLAVLNKSTGNPVEPERLRRIAGRIGSDVPLFLEPGASLGRGRGEITEPFDLPEFWLVVVKPREGLSTPAVFRRYAATPPEPKRSLADYRAAIESAKRSPKKETKTGGESKEPKEKNNAESKAASGFGAAGDSANVVRAVAAGAFNRLEAVASTIWEGVARYKTALAALPNALCAQMTGSGTAFFAIFPDEAAAREAAKAFDAANGEEVFVAKTVSNEYNINDKRLIKR